MKFGNLGYNEDESLPTVLIMRDSFMGGYKEDMLHLLRYLPQHFGKTIVIHNHYFKHFYELVDIFEPDVVIFESVERGVRLYIDLLNMIEKTD